MGLRTIEKQQENKDSRTASAKQKTVFSNI